MPPPKAREVAQVVSFGVLSEKKPVVTHKLRQGAEPPALILVASPTLFLA